jgi:pyruvate dehydrogenase E2 component (dihydrolipoamide acetyltransferase)
MSEAIVMPKLGMDMTEATLLNWTKQVGDTINVGDVIAEVETDKVTVEVESPVAGTILDLQAEPGAVVAVGSVIGHVGAAGEPAQAGPQPASARAAASADDKKVAAPQVATSARPSGNGAATAVPATPAVETTNGNLPDGVRASPIARKLASDKGIDLRQVRGTGPGGRIIKSDVESFTPSAAPAPAAAKPMAIPAPTYGEVPSGSDVEVIELSKLRERIGRRMTESKQQVPHFYVTTEMDVDALLALRKQLNDGLEEAQKITVNDLLVKATALTLRKFPNLNTHFYGDRVVRYKRINIGMAVALPQGGLINVVAKDADKTALSSLAQHNKEMIARAREGKVKPDDIEGSTFTVSNLGPYEVEHFIAVINPPEAGILAIGTAQKTPVVKDDGTVGVITRLKITISVDHRVSDGAEGAQFLQAFKDLVENPMRLLI